MDQVWCEAGSCAPFEIVLGHLEGAAGSHVSGHTLEVIELGLLAAQDYQAESWTEGAQEAVSFLPQMFG